MTEIELKNTIEALLFASNKPLSSRAISEIIGEIDIKKVKEIIETIRADYTKRNTPYEIREIAGGWQVLTKKEFSPFIKKLYSDKTTFKLSSSSMETIAIVSYRQPITRAEIEEIRGVDTSSVIQTLLDKNLIKVCGKKEGIGSPLLYATTEDFLIYFRLKNLGELPQIEEIENKNV